MDLLFRADDRLLLADELFLIGQRARKGKPLVSADVIRTGLAGAALGELLLRGRITIAENKVLLADPRPWNERVSDHAIAEIVRQGNNHTVRAWVEYLREDVRDLVAARLVERRIVVRQAGRRLLGSGSVRYPAVNTVLAGRPRVRMGYVLARNEDIDPQMAALTGLVRACGLDRMMGEDYGRDFRVRLQSVIDDLPPPLRSLVSGVDAAIAAIALTIRR